LTSTYKYNSIKAGGNYHLPFTKQSKALSNDHIYIYITSDIFKYIQGFYCI